MRNMLCAAFALVVSVGSIAYGEHSTPSNARVITATAKAGKNMTSLKIRITINERAVIATLADNPTARDFHSLLPMTLTLSDYASTEKISYLPRKLSKDSAPSGFTPAVGDLAYYAPWGNLAIFYKGFDYSEGLIKLGTVDSGLEALLVSGTATVRIEPFAD